MTEAEPTPSLHRFPWVQLAFCLACLAMAVWTWMRYSYAWSISERRLWESFKEHDLRHVRLIPDPVADEPGRLLSPDDYRKVRGWPLLNRYVRVTYDVMPRREQRVGYGRVAIATKSESRPLVYTRASRFTGASVAGLAVGAMGCFIFGLYFRRWLRARKAAG